MFQSTYKLLTGQLQIKKRKEILITKNLNGVSYQTLKNLIPNGYILNTSHQTNMNIVLKISKTFI